MCSPRGRASIAASFTARVQTVTAESSGVFHPLIRAFAERTGVPLVLNTSSNLNGMPIVESPWGALRCFASSDMDRLLLGRLADL